MGCCTSSVRGVSPSTSQFRGEALGEEIESLGDVQEGAAVASCTSDMVVNIEPVDDTMRNETKRHNVEEASVYATTARKEESRQPVDPELQLSYMASNKDRGCIGSKRMRSEPRMENSSGKQGTKRDKQSKLDECISEKLPSGAPVSHSQMLGPKGMSNTSVDATQSLSPLEQKYQQPEVPFIRRPEPCELKEECPRVGPVTSQGTGSTIESKAGTKNLFVTGVKKEQKQPDYQERTSRVNEPKDVM